MPLDEAELRVRACGWLKSHYSRRKYLLPPLVFHNLSMTITQYLYRNFKGKELTRIPHHGELEIRPDIIAINIFPNDKQPILTWMIGECKSDKVSIGDFGQAIRYANRAEAYEAYLFYDGYLSRDVKTSIRSGGHLYSGINRWGKPVQKMLILMKYEKQQGNRLGEFEVAYKAHNMTDKWSHAYGILRQNNATITNRYHGPDYAYSYGLYGNAKIYRQKLKRDQA
ncbi:MAG: hypothetical protein ACE5NG_19725 [bacterium]